MLCMLFSLRSNRESVIITNTSMHLLVHLKRQLVPAKGTGVGIKSVQDPIIDPVSNTHKARAIVHLYEGKIVASAMHKCKMK